MTSQENFLVRYLFRFFSIFYLAFFLFFLTFPAAYEVDIPFRTKIGLAGVSITPQLNTHNPVLFNDTDKVNGLHHPSVTYNSNNGRFFAVWNEAREQEGDDRKRHIKPDYSGKKSTFVAHAEHEEIDFKIVYPKVNSYSLIDRRNQRTQFI